VAVKKRLKKFGSRWAFELFVEVMHEQIVKALRKYLRGLEPKDIPAMVSEGRFPPLEGLDLTAVSDNAEQFEKISLVSLWSLLPKPALTWRLLSGHGHARSRYWRSCVAPH